MVQIVENWSDLTGVVRKVGPAPKDGFTAVTLHVDRADPVEEFAHLLKDAAGTELEVWVPDALASERGIAAGRRLRCRVRRADLKRSYVHRDHLVVDPTAAGAGA